jgi:hypothetical protein
MRRSAPDERSTRISEAGVVERRRRARSRGSRGRCWTTTEDNNGRVVTLKPTTFRSSSSRIAFCRAAELIGEESRAMRRSAPDERSTQKNLNARRRQSLSVDVGLGAEVREAAAGQQRRTYERRLVRALDEEDVAYLICRCRACTTAKPPKLTE